MTEYETLYICIRILYFFVSLYNSENFAAVQETLDLQWIENSRNLFRDFSPLVRMRKAPDPRVTVIMASV